MANILVVYASDYSNTQKMAQSILEGIKSIPSAKGFLKTAEEATAEDVMKADALILGSPVHMGSPDWRVKKFIDTICSRLWMQDALVGKVGGVFATGGGYGGAGGGSEITLVALLNNLAELGMIIVPLPKNTPGYEEGGLQWGPYARSQGVHMEQTGVQPKNLEAAKHHGMNIAKLALALKGQEIFTGPVAAKK